MNLPTHILVGTIVVAFPLGAQAAFHDVPASHPNAAAIHYMQEQGIVRGYNDGTFRPNQTVNRAEFTKIALGAFPPEEPLEGICSSDSDIPFSDIHFSDWFREVVCVAKHYNRIDGHPDGTFRAGNPVSFAEAAKIAIRDNSLGYYNLPEPDTTWYQPYAQLLELHRAIPLSIQSLNQPLTRGEVAEILYRLRVSDGTKPYAERPSRTYLSLHDPDFPFDPNRALKTKIFYVRVEPPHLQDIERPIECPTERNLVPLEVVIPKTKATLLETYRAAFSELGKERTMGESCFGGNSCHDVGGFFNALSDSDVTVEKATIVDGVASIALKGELITQDICDEERLQLQALALQFPSVRYVDITVHGEPLINLWNSRGE